ncbi:MAG: MerR family transcriptional regulator [Pseudonocardiaceae bacterium]
MAAQRKAAGQCAASTRSDHVTSRSRRRVVSVQVPPRTLGVQVGGDTTGGAGRCGRPVRGKRRPHHHRQLPGTQTGDLLERSPGGQRRYSRAELALAARVRELLDQNMPLAAAIRIVELEYQLAQAQRRITELEQSDGHAEPGSDSGH